MGKPTGGGPGGGGLTPWAKLIQLIKTSVIEAKYFFLGLVM